jgi:hypothetical protein
LFEEFEIGLNVKFLLTLTNKKRPPGDDPSAFNLRIKELPKYLYQKEAVFLLRSRDLQ